MRVIADLKSWAPIPIKATLLGAHALPLAFKNNRQAYIQMVVSELIPAAAAEAMITSMCFATRVFLVSKRQTMLEAALKVGMRPKIHANELGLTGGVQAGLKYKALSVDHLEHLGES